MMDKMNDANHPEKFKNYTDWAKFSIHEALSSKEVTGVERITVMLAFLVIEFAAYLDMNIPTATSINDMLGQASIDDMLGQLFGYGKGKDGDK